MNAQPDPVPVVPYDVPLEQALLGSLLLHNKLIDVVSADLEASAFYDPLHQRLYEMIVYLQTEGDVTPVVVNAVLKSDPGLMAVGGIKYLAHLVGAAPSTPDVRSYSRILREFAARRTLMGLGEQLLAEAPAGPSQQVADQVTESLLAIGRSTAKPVKSVYDIGMETMAEIEAVMRGDPIPVIKTGLYRIDDEIGGLRGGDFIVMSGKSGMGKSALAGSISRNTAKAGVPTLVFSKEMTRQQWTDRLVCDEDFDSYPGKPLWYSRVRKHRLEKGEPERFAKATRDLQGIPMDIRDEDDLNVVQMSAIARAFKAKHAGKLGIVFVDYLQIVEPLDYRENRERQVAQIARGLKGLAKRLGWPVVALSQMNENDKNRAKEEKRPQLSDLRESGVIGQEADMVFAPYRAAYWMENRKPDVTAGEKALETWNGELAGVQHRFEVLCLKNRHGRRDDFDLWCEIGANAVRDQAPSTMNLREESADLLGYRR